MRQKHNHFKLNWYTLSALTLLVVFAVTLTTLYNQHNHTEAAPATKEAVGAAVPSQFTFTGATDWWQGATRMTDMALFHKIHDSCFTSIQHKTGSIVADKAKLQKNETDLVSSGHTLTHGDTLTVTLQTSTGQKSYQLQQSTVTTPPDGLKVLGGQEFGYLPLSDNDYIFVKGYCETTDELAATIPALQAIKFDAAKR